jgi:hypothetical protein
MTKNASYGDFAMNIIVKGINNLVACRKASDHTLILRNNEDDILGDAVKSSVGRCYI